MPHFKLSVGMNVYNCDLLKETEECFVNLQLMNLADFTAVQTIAPSVAELIHMDDGKIESRILIPGTTLDLSEFIIKCEAVIN